ncbi:MAG TPA: hypothetical protein VGK77_08535 [Candidatus Binatia bacterium]|jgi:hypothetical protein
MLEDRSYAALLRPIGQMLETLRIESFAVKPDGEGFIIRDKTRSRAQLTPRERAFLAELHSSHTATLDKEDALRLAAGVFEWHLTQDDIERFEREGHGRRGSPEHTLDSHSVSQILRVVGSILDQKRGQLGYVSKDEQVVTVEYTLPGGQKNSEEYNLPMLYDYWVRMYKKRNGHNGIAPMTP